MKTNKKILLCIFAIITFMIASCTAAFATNTTVPEPYDLEWIKEDDGDVFFTWYKNPRYHHGADGPGNALKFHMELYRDGKLLRTAERIHNNQHLYLSDEELQTPGTYTVKIRAEAGQTSDVWMDEYVFQYATGNTQWLGTYSNWVTSPEYVISGGNTPSHVHTYSEEFKSDANSHFKACECGDKTEVNAHTFGEWKVDKKPTVTAKGQEARTCTVCSYKETRDIPATGIGQITTPPTSTNEGVIAFEVPVEKETKLQIVEVNVSEKLKGTEKDLKKVYDISLLSGENEVVKITNNKMQITLTLSEDLKDYDKFEVIYIEDGNVKERIPATRNGDKLTFVTNHLSEYGIVATKTAEEGKPENVKPQEQQKPQEDNKPQEQDKTENNTPQQQENSNKKEDNSTNPQTGDNIIIFSVILAIAVIGLTVSIIITKKKSKNNK